MNPERLACIKPFSKRLTELMITMGLESTRSQAKVKITDLAEVSGCSVQMARRYVMGEALPEVEIIVKIAKWLNVSPGWLLFGE